MHSCSTFQAKVEQTKAAAETREHKIYLEKIKGLCSKNPGHPAIMFYFILDNFFLKELKADEKAALDINITLKENDTTQEKIIHMGVIDELLSVDNPTKKQIEDYVKPKLELLNDLLLLKFEHFETAELIDGLLSRLETIASSAANAAPILPPKPKTAPPLPKVNSPNKDLVESSKVDFLVKAKENIQTSEKEVLRKKKKKRIGKITYDSQTKSESDEQTNSEDEIQFLQNGLFGKPGYDPRGEKQGSKLLQDTVQPELSTHQNKKTDDALAIQKIKKPKPMDLFSSFTEAFGHAQDDKSLLAKPASEFLDTKKKLSKTEKSVKKKRVNKQKLESKLNAAPTPLPESPLETQGESVEVVKVSEPTLHETAQPDKTVQQSKDLHTPPEVKIVTPVISSGETEDDEKLKKVQTDETSEDLQPIEFEVPKQEPVIQTAEKQLEVNDSGNAQESEPKLNLDSINPPPELLPETQGESVEVVVNEPTGPTQPSKTDQQNETPELETVTPVSSVETEDGGKLKKIQPDENPNELPQDSQPIKSKVPKQESVIQTIEKQPKVSDSGNAQESEPKLNLDSINPPPELLPETQNKNVAEVIDQFFSSALLLPSVFGTGLDEILNTPLRPEPELVVQHTPVISSVRTEDNKKPKETQPENSNELLQDSQPIKSKVPEQKPELRANILVPISIADSAQFNLLHPRAKQLNSEDIPTNILECLATFEECINWYPATVLNANYNILIVLANINDKIKLYFESNNFDWDFIQANLEILKNYYSSISQDPIEKSPTQPNIDKATNDSFFNYSVEKLEQIIQKKDIAKIGKKIAIATPQKIQDIQSLFSKIETDWNAKIKQETERTFDNTFLESLYDKTHKQLIAEHPHTRYLKEFKKVVFQFNRLTSLSETLDPSLLQKFHTVLQNWEKLKDLSLEDREIWISKYGLVELCDSLNAISASIDKSEIQEFAVKEDKDLKSFVKRLETNFSTVKNRNDSGYAEIQKIFADINIDTATPARLFLALQQLQIIGKKKKENSLENIFSVLTRDPLLDLFYIDLAAIDLNKIPKHIPNAPSYNQVMQMPTRPITTSILDDHDSGEDPSSPSNSGKEPSFELHSEDNDTPSCFPWRLPKIF